LAFTAFLIDILLCPCLRHLTGWPYEWLHSSLLHIMPKKVADGRGLT